MDLEQLHTFHVVAKHKNYSKAAKELNVTQPTVTTRIFKLEQELGCKLFVRFKHSISLTKEGELFTSYSHRMLDLFEEAKNTISANKPTLKIGVCPGIFTEMITGVLRRIDPNIVNVSMEFEYYSDLLMDKLLDDQLDFAFTIRPKPHKDIHSENIINAPLVFFVNSTHRLAQYPEITAELLHGETVICLDRKLDIVPETALLFKDIRLNVIECKRAEVKKELVALGQGFAFDVPHLFKRSELEGITIKPFEEINEITLHISISCKKEFAKNEFFILFCEELRKQFPPHEIGNVRQ